MTAQRNAQDAQHVYWSKLTALAGLANITAARIDEQPPYEEAMGRLQILLDDTRDAGRRLEYARAHLDYMKSIKAAQAHDVAAE